MYTLAQTLAVLLVSAAKSIYRVTTFNIVRGASIQGPQTDKQLHGGTKAELCETLLGHFKLQLINAICPSMFRTCKVQRTAVLYGRRTMAAGDVVKLILLSASGSCKSYSSLQR